MPRGLRMLSFERSAISNQPSRLSETVGSGQFPYFEESTGARSPGPDSSFWLALL